MANHRHLDAVFFQSLREGLLAPLTDRIRRDRTLLLSLRGSSINVYYRGGSLIQLRQTTSGVEAYRAFFDSGYLGGTSIDLPSSIANSESLAEWLSAIPRLKDAMDLHFGSGKLEREFQQVVARENNQSIVANESEYFVTDIEYADAGARFDIVAVKWLREHRRTVDRCRLCLIEMKYGDAALGGGSGLVDHLKDLHNFVSNPSNVAVLRQSAQQQFNQLRELGLIEVRQTRPIEVSDQAPEIVFLLANHHPESTVLARTLEKLRSCDEYADACKTGLYDVKFFSASFAGYALHSGSMLTLDQFEKQVQALLHKDKAGFLPPIQPGACP